MVDASPEAQNLSKRLSKMQSEYDALSARLGSPSDFIGLCEHHGNLSRKKEMACLHVLVRCADMDDVHHMFVEKAVVDGVREKATELGEVEANEESSFLSGIISSNAGLNDAFCFLEVLSYKSVHPSQFGGRLMPISEAIGTCCGSQS